MNCWKFYKHVDVPLQLQVFSCCYYYWGIVASQVVLGSAVQGNRSAICIHISPLSWTSLRTHPPSHPSRPSQSTDLSSLGYIAASPLAVSFTYGSAHKSVPVSQFIPPTLFPHIHSLHLCLCSCSANRFICTIFFRFHIHALICLSYRVK